MYANPRSRLARQFPMPERPPLPDAPGGAPLGPRPAVPTEPGNDWDDTFRQGVGGMDPRGMKPKQLQRRLMGLFGFNAATFNPYLHQSLFSLMNRANQSQFSPEHRAAFLAPRMEAISDFERQAEGRLEQDLASRGLGDSTAMVGGLSNLRGQGMELRSNLVSDLFQSEQDRQDQAQDALRAALMGMVTGHGAQAGGMASDRMNYRLQKLLMQAQTEGGSWLDSILGTVGGLAGIGAGLGWQPFGSKKG